MCNLPKGWIHDKLRYIADVIMGQSPPSTTYNSHGEGLPFFQGKAEFGNFYPTPIKYCNRPQKIAATGDVLISVRAPVGPTNLCKEQSCIGRGLAALRPKGNIISKYLLYYLRNIETRIANLGTGSTFTAISKSILEEIDIVFPPLTEQRRIVAKLEKLLARVDACRERLNKIPALLKRFRQSVLATACSGRLTADWREAHIEVITDKDSEISEYGLPEIPETWRWVKLPNTGEMSRGKSRHRPRNAPFLFGGSYPFIQTGDIAQSGGRITNHKQSYSKAGLDQSRLWPVNTVCITIAANIAASALLTYPACFPDSVVGIITERSKCLPEFLEFFIRTAKSDLSTFAPATAQKNINIKILSDVLVPLPHLLEQQEIVRRVEALFKIADQIEARYQKAKVHVDRLTQSILANAFRGDLVPQDPSDEPASALLERIRQERKTR